MLGRKFFCYLMFSLNTGCLLLVVPARDSVARGVFSIGGMEEDTVRRTWQEELFLTYFESTPRVGVDSNPSRFGLVGDRHSKLRQDSVYLYNGIRELTNGNNRQAIIYLKKAADGVRGMRYATADWYLGLAYLRTNQLDNAEYLINAIAETEIHPYQLLADLLYKAILKGHEAEK